MRERFDIAVIGAGPAGIAAAMAAAGQGARVALIDAQARAGGQVWRHDVRAALPTRARRAIATAVQHRRVKWMPQTRLALVESGRLLLETPRDARWLDCGTLVLATGARELLLPFPGWTLPGVTGAGGLQALAKQGWPLAGKRVAVAGSGPLLLAAALTARRHGARVVGIFEQAPVAAMVGFLRGLWRWPSKLRQALMLRSQLLGVPYHWSSVVCAAHGDEALREIEWDGPRGRGRIACEHLAVGYGLVPNLEPARQLGCRLESVGAHAQVWVDARQQTSVPRVFAAGEACGIGGLDAALIEGEIAGRVAAGAYSGLPELQRRRARARAFAAELALRFTLSPRVHALATPDTLVCRCEDVPLGALDGFVDARDARLATRCGMGACQGRVCGAALAELGHAAAFVPRPPLSPVRLDTLATPRRV